LPELDPSENNRQDRIDQSQSNLNLVVARLLGLGLSAELIAEAIAAHCRIFSCTKDLDQFPAHERVSKIRERFKSVEITFTSELEVAVEADPTGDLEAPRFNWKTERAYDEFVTASATAAKENKFLKTYTALLRKTAITIKRATDLMPKLDQQLADLWSSKRSWTLGEFAALSLGRIPIVHGTRTPAVPLESSIAAVFREYHERHDQLRRAVALKKGSQKLDHTANTPSDSLAWARANNFPFDELLQPRPAPVYLPKDFLAFVDLALSKRQAVAQNAIKFRKGPFRELFNELFPRAHSDAYQHFVWGPLDLEVAAKKGTVSDLYLEDWRPVRDAVVEAWTQRRGQLLMNSGTFNSKIID
jgi:hypothetical protein